MKDSPPNKIFVCFTDPRITEIFAQLMETQASLVERINRLSDYDGVSRIVTETRFAQRLPAQAIQRCLLVGEEQELVTHPGIKLAKPLTEDAVEEALAQFRRA